MIKLQRKFSAGAGRTRSDALALAEKRDRLLKRLERFHQQAVHHLGVEAMELMPISSRSIPDFQIPDGMRTGEDEGATNDENTNQPECVQ